VVLDMISIHRREG